MKIVPKCFLAALIAAASFTATGKLPVACLVFASVLIVFSPWLIYIIPRRFVSFLVGKMMRVPLGIFREPVLRLYIKAFGVDMSTVERPLKEYKSVQEFFNRQIDLSKRGFALRNIKWELENAQEGTVYAPADSVLSQYGYIDAQNKARVKGAQFSLQELVLENAAPNQVFFAVFYLSPADYHAFHCPFRFDVTKIAHVHGDHWPVNDTFMPKIPGLLAKNERVVLSGTWGGSKAWYVPVGALNVASISMNDFQLIKGKQFNTQYSYLPGSQMGQFQFGSTVVVLFEVPKGKQIQVVKDGKVKTGDAVLRVE